MASIPLGETAALATACLWTVNSILFTEGGKRIGARAVNAIRIALAIAFLGITHIVLLGGLRMGMSGGQYFWLSFSGVLGLGIGDFATFASFVMMGPRKVLLVMSLAPVAAAISAYLILTETLGSLAILGMAITLVGVVLVVLEGKGTADRTVKKRENLGYGLAAVGAVSQGLGLTVAKYGMVGISEVAIDPLSVTLVRMVAGGAFVWLVLAAWGKLGEIRKAFKDPVGIKYTSAGAAVGPYLGVWGSMVAVRYAPAGVASTIMGIMPVLIIPAVWLTHKERTNWRGMAGAAIAFMGVALLFLY